MCPRVILDADRVRDTGTRAELAAAAGSHGCVRARSRDEVATD